jgi:16S rRNA C967 or C1407 C5-methylase (RsmB/RsmF family)
VKPGGKLIYSACTLAHAETSGIAELFKQQVDFAPKPIANPIDASSPASSEIYFLPQQSGGNGMYVAAWIRTSSR